MRRRGEVGRCCLGLIPLLVVVVVAAYFGLSLVSSPSLGAPPQGPNDGATRAAITQRLGLELAAQLRQNPQANVIVSELDLTVFADANNPDPGTFANPQVRSRNGELLVSAGTYLGPVSTVSTVDANVALTSPGTTHQQVTLSVTSFALGHITLPLWMRAGFDNRGDAVVEVNQILPSSVAQNIDCVAVVPTGLVVWVHRPGIAGNSALCGATPAS